jgi:hypothetical protein
VSIDNIAISSEYEDVFFMQPEDSENKDNVNNESSFLDEAYAQCIFQFGLILCAIITGNAISCDGHSLQEIRDEVEQNVIDGIPPALEAIAYQCCETLANNRPTDKLIYSEIKDLLETYQPLKEDLFSEADKPKEKSDGVDLICGGPFHPCDKPAMLLCGGCETMRYCGRHCQKVHWSEHKKAFGRRLLA